MKLRYILAVSLLVFTNLVFAQKNTTVSTEKPPTANRPSPLLLGFKSWDDSGRIATQNVSGARNFKSKNEFFLGYKDQSGWGAYAQISQTYNSLNNNSALTKWYRGDSSITLLHPDCYSDSTTKVFGQFRYYIPTTERSVQKSIQQFAYYFRVSYQMTAAEDIFNEATPRYFNSKNYDLGDTTYSFEDTATYNYKLNKDWKVGAKSYMVYEVHSAEAPGFSWEIGPAAVYTINSNLSISPSISMPAAVKNRVYDGPRAVSTDQAYLDVFLQAKL